MNTKKTENPLLIAATPMRNDMLGGISDMTLHRWLHNDDLRFPRPIYIGSRRFWKTAEVIDWLDGRKEVA